MIDRMLSVTCPHCGSSCNTVAMGELVAGSLFACGSFMPKLTRNGPGVTEEKDSFVRSSACRLLTIQRGELVSLREEVRQLRRILREEGTL